MRRLIVFVIGLQLLLVALAFGQTAQLTQVAAIAGDSTKAIVNRGGVEYLPGGVIWVAVGDYPHTGKNTAYLSTDNGSTWVKRPIITNATQSSPGAITAFTAKDANIALAGLGTGEILRTSNGGVKWDTVTSYTDGFIDGVRFVSGDTVIAYGDDVGTGVYVARSFDAGKTWTRVPNTNANLPGDSLNALGTASAGSIYAGSASYGQAMEVYGRTIWLSLYNTTNDPPSILKSTDAGATWSWFRVTLPSGPATNYIILSLTFKDQNVGYAVSRRAYSTSTSNSNYLCKTTDGGRTWSDTISVEPGKGHVDAKPMTVKAIRGTNTVIAVGYGTIGAKSWISNDNGATWAPIATPTPNANADLRNIAFASTTEGFAIGSYNMVKVAITGLAPVQTQLLLNDDFTGAAGTALTSAGWTFGNSTTNPLTITSPSLSFTGHPGSGVGGAVAMANNGQDDYRAFAPVSSGNVYLSFLMNVSAALTGDYFIALSPSTLQTNYYARLHVKSSGSGYSFGISKNNEASGGAQYGTTVYNFNTAYFVTVKYSFTGAVTDTTANDPISVYVLPSGSSLATEPATPEINGYVTNGRADASDLGFVTLRQGSATLAPTLVIDAVRVGNAWASATASADTVNVTFWANTSTVPDTLQASSLVQIRGAAPLFGPWSADSKAILTNVAGDYWKGTYKLKIGDTIQYKFFTNAKKPLPAPAGDQGGWEQNSTDPSSNRVLIVGAKDTTLPLQFVNGTPTNQPQYFTPYVSEKDSIEVWFRINMAGNPNFSKNSQFIGVRGGTAPLDWGKSIVLTKESQHGNGSSRQYDGTNFWSGYARFPKSAFASTISYKYVILGSNSPSADVTAWEDGIKPASDVGGDGNRNILASPGISDTTIAWKWWANNPFVPFTGSDTVIVTFRANLQRAVSERGFAFGDTLQVRSGYGGTGGVEGRTKKMERSGLTGTIFTVTDTVVASVGKLLHYQYYMVKNGVEVKEDFYDFNWTGAPDQAERRKLSVASKNLTVYDTTTALADLRRMPRFSNTTKLTKPVNVTWTVDVRPAIYTVKAGKKLVATNITPYVIGNADSIKIWGVWMNGPAVGGWDTRGAWGPARRADSLSKMYDDGTHGDLLAGDSVYSLKWRYTTSDFVGQVFKFGIGGLDNEGGFGNNHTENVSDADTVFTIASQFGSIDPKFFNSWNFDLKKPQVATAVEDNWSVPMTYELSQNYPNPFNPSTTIQFIIPAQDVVTLKVFNVLGQEVMTILNEKMDAGKHSVRFDASKLTSGVYLYQVSAGKFVETKKMILLK